ncbi:MAG: hypothetical protein GX905_08865 [Bacteroidales bacterium]|nr:hypothetical protein [Bacteroidales bacterium]
MLQKFSTRYLIAGWCDEEDIILCTVVNGKLLKKVYFVQEANAAIK